MNKPTYPAWHLYSGRQYTPSEATDIRKTFERCKPDPSQYSNAAVRRLMLTRVKEVA